MNEQMEFLRKVLEASEHSFEDILQRVEDGDMRAAFVVGMYQGMLEMVAANSDFPQEVQDAAARNAALLRRVFDQKEEEQQ